YQNSLIYKKIADITRANEQLKKAIKDLEKAAELYQQGGRTQSYQDTLNFIQKLKGF
ncbi:MAG: hypothetical protein F6K17_25740, partial [Okeania sp. SIO3C4]|nr:hypothetical protein [Okeania sp. SIO3C4]